MSISGNLADVSVADVMQFIHLGGRTGTLVIKSEAGQAEIGFHRGQIVSASAPGSTPGFFRRIQFSAKSLLAHFTDRDERMICFDSRATFRSGNGLAAMS